MTIKSSITKYLEENGRSWGGDIARKVGHELKKKESNVERRCRELEDAGVIRASYAQVEGQGNKCVMYELTPQNPATRQLEANKAILQEKLFSFTGSPQH